MRINLHTTFDINKKNILTSTPRSMVSLSKPNLYFFSARYTGGKKAAQEVAKAVTKTTLPPEISSASSMKPFNNPPAPIDFPKAPFIPQTPAPAVSSYQNFSNRIGFERLAQASISRPRALNGSEKAQKSNEILDLVHKKNVTALQEFCKHFSHLTVEQICNDAILVNYINKMVEENPGLMLSRMGVSLIEGCYSQRKFAKCTIEDLVKGKAKIEAFPGVAGEPFTDQSTVHNGVEVNYIFNSDTPFRNWPHVTIFETPKGGIRVEELSPSARRWVETVKKLTGNTVNDLNIGEHPYDFKAVHVPGVSHNHIYGYDYEDLHKISKYLHDLENYFMQERNSNRDALERTYFKEGSTILNTLNQQQASTEQKLEAWNKFVVDTLARRPLNCSFPIVYQTTNIPFEPDPNLKTDKYPNLRKRSLQVNEVKDATMTHVGKNKNKMGNSAKIGTNGVIDVTKTTSTDEVD
jgi:hypothetical protein